MMKKTSRKKRPMLPSWQKSWRRERLEEVDAATGNAEKWLTHTQLKKLMELLKRELRRRTLARQKMDQAFERMLKANRR